MKSSIFLLVIILTGSMTAHAKCTPVASRYNGSWSHETCLDVNGIMRVGVASLSPIKCTGEVACMTHADAMNACPVGTHLTTTRELAELSHARGAQGILKNTDGSSVTREQVEGGAVRRPLFYYLITGINPDGIKDEFYFNEAGYQRAHGDLGNNFFWSSSACSYSTEYPYVIESAHGFFFVSYDYGLRDYDMLPLICIATR